MAVGAVAGTGLAVVSGAAGWDTAHRLLAALALPWLVGLLVVAWVSARRLLPSAARASSCSARRAADRAAVHLARRRSRSARPSCSRAHSRRCDRRPSAAAGLRHADEAARDEPAAPDRRARRRSSAPAACRPGACSRSTMVGLALACGGVGALNHYLDRDIDPLMGARTASARSRRAASRRASRSSSGSRSRRLVRAARRARQPADGAARARREPLLRPRLHALAEAHDAAEHRHRRRGRRGAAARRLRRCGRPPRLGGARHVRHRLPLDAAALLGARA
jgi:hypothetical protein